MRFCQYRTGEGQRRIGLAHADAAGVDRIVDLAAAGKRLGLAHAFPDTLLRLIEEGAPALAAAREVAAALAADPGLAADPALSAAPEAVHLEAPVTRPPKFFSVAINGGANWRSATKPANPNPHYFIKLHTSIVGPYDPVEIPDVGQVGPEVELAVIIGKGGRNIPQERALEHVFGYTTHNDITAHEMRKTTEWILMHRADGSEERLTYPGRYKNFDRTAPMGPWLVTADAVPDPNALHLRAWLNGDLCQEGTNADHIYPVEKLVAYLSEAHTLEPGDIISTGTVAAKAPWTMTTIDLGKSGGVVAAEVEGIGRVENPIVFLGAQ